MHKNPVDWKNRGTWGDEIIRFYSYRRHRHRVTVVNHVVEEMPAFYVFKPKQLLYKNGGFRERVSYLGSIFTAAGVYTPRVLFVWEI